MSFASARAGVADRTEGTPDMLGRIRATIRLGLTSLLLVTRPDDAGRKYVAIGDQPRVISRSAFPPEQDDEKHSEEVGTMVNRYFVNIEPIEPSGVVLTVEALPRLLIFGETPEDALHRACEAIGFQLCDTSRSVDRPAVELVPRDSVGTHQPSSRQTARGDRARVQQLGPAQSHTEGDGDRRSPHSSRHATCGHLR